jgi:hypothetical protein
MAGGVGARQRSHVLGRAWRSMRRPLPRAYFNAMNVTVEARDEAIAELLRLREREQQANARVDDVSRQAREATGELAAAREALVELERRAGNGVTLKARREAEARLAVAEERAGERWPERRVGAERAVRDAHHAVQLHVAAHLGELVSVFEERGRDAADQVDDAARRFIEAVARRAEVEREVTSLLALVRVSRVGDVARARSDAAAREVTRFLERGGEAPPTVRAELAPTAA